MFVGVARLTLQIPDSGSLKAKRQILRRVTDRVKARFNASVAEVADNDLWQKAVIGVAVIGNDTRHVNEQLEKIIHFVDELYVAPLLAREIEILGFGERLEQFHAGGFPAEGREGEDEEGLKLEIPRGERSLAEVEGIPWEQRHRGGREPDLGRRAGKPGRPGQKLTLDEARARARALRNRRDWEKE
jgi:uncharacterized protein YlxP (DUF503 family)